ncbi:MAG TPA: ATP-binding protein [Planctomycetota bacterium]|nr:ATP-binding protein [Planctomycetota bacterium]
MNNDKPRALLAWSSGKDSAWALHVLRQQQEVEVVGLLTTINEAFDRVAMHGVRRTLVEAQARAAGLPLWTIPIPWPCSNEEYEKRMSAAIARARSEGITRMAFGDLFLEDVRQYRIDQLRGTGIEPLFPVWGSRENTPVLAREMQAGGLRAVLASLDPRQIDPKFVGRQFDAQLLIDLPVGADPCGENGEFHTFCYAGPMFSQPVAVKTGETVERDGFWFCDILPQ